MICRLAGRGLAAEAIRAGLVDEYHYFAHPVIVGGGRHVAARRGAGGPVARGRAAVRWRGRVPGYSSGDGPAPCGRRRPWGRLRRASLPGARGSAPPGCAGRPAGALPAPCRRPGSAGPRHRAERSSRRPRVAEAEEAPAQREEGRLRRTGRVERHLMPGLGAAALRGARLISAPGGPGRGERSSRRAGFTEAAVSRAQRGKRRPQRTPRVEGNVISGGAARYRESTSWMPRCW